MSDTPQHWAEHKERGNFWLMKLTAFGVKVLGRRLLAPVLYAIVLYFFVFGRKARRSIWHYQQHLADWSGQPALRPTSWRVFGQFMAFADALLDKPAKPFQLPNQQPSPPRSSSSSASYNTFLAPPSKTNTTKTLLANPRADLLSAPSSSSHTSHANVTSAPAPALTLILPPLAQSSPLRGLLRKTRWRVRAGDGTPQRPVWTRVE